MNRRRVLAILAATALPATARTETAWWRGVALGADCSVKLSGPGAQATLDGLPALLTRIEDQFSLYRPTSALSRLNRTGTLADPHPEMRRLLALCDRVHHATQGLFDPTVQPLWQALATGGDTDRARALIGWTRVDWRKPRLAPGQALTFNGIAQGFASDLVRAHLARAGFTRALVNIGEYAALGGPWTLGIADPARGLVAARRLTGTAIATSSPGATTLHGVPHILDPLGTARPLWSTVSVEADSAALADGLSTALCFVPAARIGAIRRGLPGMGAVTLVGTDGRVTTI